MSTILYNSLPKDIVNYIILDYLMPAKEKVYMIKKALITEINNKSDVIRKNTDTYKGTSLISIEYRIKHNKYGPLYPFIYLDYFKLNYKGKIDPNRPAIHYFKKKYDRTVLDRYKEEYKNFRRLYYRLPPE